MEGRALPASLRRYRYRKRAIVFAGWQPVGRWCLKTTVITVRGLPVHFAEETEAAQALAGLLLAALPEDGGDVGVASLIVHVGSAGVWVLLDWWRDGDILMHRHFFAPLDDPTRLADVAGQHLGPCVWELAVQAHERAAWLRHVLANDAGPDLDGYLGDGLTATL